MSRLSAALLVAAGTALALNEAGCATTQYQPQVGKDKEQVLETFDRNVAAAKSALTGTTDEHLMKPWSLKMGGKTILTLPRAAVVRNFVLNHNIHHRAQLGVYLRLNDIPLPSIYGPSADEGSMG